MPAGDSRSNCQNLDIVPLFDITSQKFYSYIIPLNAGWTTRFLLISSTFIAIIIHSS